uniref:F-box domain-containing protein n=1 Tax=Mycena chlorophos TaxID=658473 RepID=A0ABQ0LAF4_MYCCL|nr:predicted protein [Mycena chlorophos]
MPFPDLLRTTICCLVGCAALWTTETKRRRADGKGDTDPTPPATAVRFLKFADSKPHIKLRWVYGPQSGSVMTPEPTHRLPYTPIGGPGGFTMSNNNTRATWLQLRKNKLHTVPESLANGGKDFLSSLHVDLLFQLLAYLHPVELMQLSRTCKQLRTVIFPSDDKAADDIWRRSFQVEVAANLPRHPSMTAWHGASTWWAQMLFGVPKCQRCGAVQASGPFVAIYDRPWVLRCPVSCELDHEEELSNAEQELTATFYVWDDENAEYLGLRDRNTAWSRRWHENRDRLFGAVQERLSDAGYDSNALECEIFWEQWEVRGIEINHPGKGRMTDKLWDQVSPELRALAERIRVNELWTEG